MTATPYTAAELAALRRMRAAGIEDHPTQVAKWLATVDAAEARARAADVQWRPEVRAFADAMERKLRKHDEGRGESWKDDGPDALMVRLREESRELSSVVGKYERARGHEAGLRVLDEAADVGNFAMMIADVCGALSAPVQAGETREQAVEACARAGWEASSTRHMEPFDADWLANARDVIDERAPEGADRWESAFATAVLREAARHPILATGASKERK